MTEGTATRTVVVTGPAGCGTSTVARAVAASAAAAGGRVAILISDPAAVRSATGTATVIEVDPLRWGQRAWQRTARLRDGAGQPWSRLAPADLLPLPGMAELAWWDTLREVWQGAFDTVVVDAGPIDSALTWLTLPDTVVGVLRRTWPLSQRTATAAAGSAPGSWHLRALERLDSEAAELAAALRSAATALHLVTRPSEHDLGRLLRQMSALALFELPVTDLIVNGVSSGEGRDRTVVTRLTQSLPQMRVRSASSAIAGSGSVAPLVMAGEIYPQGFDGGKSPRPRILRQQGEYLWRWTLPFADPAGVSAAVIGDDAILTVSRVRRVVPLPSVLRRCHLLDASVDGPTLQLRFTPDAQVWPATWEVT